MSIIPNNWFNLDIIRRKYAIYRFCCQIDFLSLKFNNKRFSFRKSKSCNKQFCDFTHDNHLIDLLIDGVQFRNLRRPFFSPRQIVGLGHQLQHLQAWYLSVARGQKPDWSLLQSFALQQMIAARLKEDSNWIAGVFTIFVALLNRIRFRLI